MIDFDFLGDYFLRDDDVFEQIYSFGYMDGLFDEVTYKSIVTSDFFDIYDKGYEDGVLYRNEHLDLVLGLKLYWVSKLSCSDFLNGYWGRNLSSYYERIYNLHYYDLVLGKGACDFDDVTRYFK